MWNLFQSRSGDNEEQGESLLGDESGGLCSLSPLQRIYGFAACLIAGLICMLVSIAVFVKPIKFAVLFTFGNLLAIGSTAFLLGPIQQIEMMFDPARVIATAVYLGFVVIALVCAFWIHSKVLTLIAIICEIAALICCCCVWSDNGGLAAPEMEGNGFIGQKLGFEGTEPKSLL